jgi:hypothetical protein
VSNGYGAYDSGGHTEEEWGPTGVEREVRPEDRLPGRPEEPVRPRRQGEYVPRWGLVGNLLAPPPTVPALTDPPPAQLYSADPGNGQPYVPWISVDHLGNLYVYGTQISGPSGFLPITGGEITGNLTVDGTTNLKGQATLGGGINFLAPSGDTTGATDLANINAGLSGFPRRRLVLGPGTFYIDAPISPANSTWLDGSGYLTTVIQQSSTFAGSYMLPSATMLAVSNLQFKAPSGTITSNVAADAIYHATNGGFVGQIYLSNLSFTNINGYCIHTDNSGGGGFTTVYGYNILNTNCAGGIHLYGIGGQFINLSVNASVSGYDGLLWEECTRGGQAYNLGLGAPAPDGTNAGGYALHFIGHNNDIIIYAGNNGGGISDCKIEDSAHGDTTGLNINDYYFQTATGPGLDIEGGSGDMMFTNCRFNANATHGAVVNGSGSKIKFQKCVWSSAGSFNSNGVGTTIAAGSNGGEISTIASWSSPSAGVLAVASAGSFSSGGGTAYVIASGSTVGVITYSGTAVGQLTGCAYVSGSPTGTVATGNGVTGGPYYDLNWSGTATGDVIDCEFASSIAVNGHAGVEESVNTTTGLNVQFQGCRFSGGSSSIASAFTNVPALVQNCSGFNPYGITSVSVPASGTATAALGYDATYYITANASGACTPIVSGGTLPSIPASAVVPVFVPATDTLKVTYSNAPTWIVFGN